MRTGKRKGGRKMTSVALRRVSSLRRNTLIFEGSVLTAPQDRFSRRKVSPNNASASAGNGIKNATPRPRNGAAVTTSHLFYPNQRRRTASPLPLWLRNPNFLGRRHDQICREGGGGSGFALARSPRSKSAHGILCLIRLLRVLYEHRSK